MPSDLRLLARAVLKADSIETKLAALDMLANAAASGWDIDVSAQGEDVFHLYLVNDQLKLNYFKKGERLLENQTIPLELDEKEGKIQYTDLASLRLLPWYGPYFVLSGLQKIRFTNEEQKEEVREVFFIQKLLLNGDLYVPNANLD